MLARLLAVVAAVAMVAGALAVRGQWDAEGGATGGDTGGDNGGEGLRHVCSTELREACEDIRGRAGRPLLVTVETARTTAERL